MSILSNLAFMCSNGDVCVGDCAHVAYTSYRGRLSYRPMDATNATKYVDSFRQLWWIVMGVANHCDGCGQAL